MARTALLNLVKRPLATSAQRILTCSKTDLHKFGGVRYFRTSLPVKANDTIGQVLEPDSSRGVRINPEAYEAVKGTPRSSEYDSINEQDPLGHQYGTGGNDDIFGEWGLDKDDFWPAGRCLAMTVGGLSLFGVFWQYLKSTNIQPVAAPREGVWSME
ncbi:hypothetical protein GUITHDRAFT_154635 [Guillardia theta CCMP2712]|uniref:Uncharacterized protein n=1 Tax=Guillardia theta (strain CCMP2712) TaxID=905079 RepID=L1IRH8_GUITC|nr:hypothetical protein GUITHDRAFT_154635 [Guillardia theta CCMP2712]EKX38833.1 hypothetical protein GUITHDRAFT_154635 [Guillardia theta CCMP2712]|eukprot:XP_005825813.1 hypothetical protein GUITHDRAFT_154635 [Guillardia theta CCMP2712]